MNPAPFLQLPDATAPPARAFWATAEDGRRLRLALWPAEKAAGTVLLLQGRSEYIEKYAPLALDLVAAGLNVITIDWRGQGLSDRLQGDARPGHIGSFADYQMDMVELVVAAQDLGLERPWHLLAHSMGGAIGLAALMDGLQVATACFSAPMWGINHSPVPRAVALALADTAVRLGRGGHAAIGTGGGTTYVLDEGFTDNLLTSAPAQWARMLVEAASWPELTLGGASYGWIGQALRECGRLAAQPSPDLPMLVGVGSRERIVSPTAMRLRVSGWAGAQLLEIDGARHELLMETPRLREIFLTAFFALIGLQRV